MDDRIVNSLATTSNNNYYSNNNKIVIIIIVIDIKIIVIIVVRVEIRIEILQGASLRMGSLTHIQITGSDIEGTDYNNNIDKYYM